MATAHTVSLADLAAAAGTSTADLAAGLRESDGAVAEELFAKTVAFEHGHGLSEAEIGARFPAANALADDASGTSVLLRAVEDDDAGAVEKLLLLGADANRANADGVTPQYVACSVRARRVARSGGRG